MKWSLALLILLFATQSLTAQSGKAHITIKPVKPVRPVAVNHGMVVRTVAHATHDGRVVSSVASSKSNGKKKYNKIHNKRKYPVAPKKATTFVP
ncbi:hypothetical protein [Niabella hirudinis]|uniref:hypothetical protein n=1 Tax=Niabella hirudinis TaxID=1285929 RepID=UPI003EC061BB